MNMDNKIHKKRGLDSAIAPFGSPNTVYAVRSLHFALPYFAPFHYAKHRIY